MSEVEEQIMGLAAKLKEGKIEGQIEMAKRMLEASHD